MKRFLQDDAGKWSATRLVMLLWVVVVLGVWVYVSVDQKELQDIPQNVTVLIGILAGGKVVQKFGEVWFGVRRQSPELPGTPRT